MTKASDENEPTEGISDDQLPEDLQPGEDNPLAEPLEPGETSEVDLNEPSRSYAKELEEAGDALGLRRGLRPGLRRAAPARPPTSEPAAA